MNPAKEVEAVILAKQNAANLVMEKFSSPVQQFYCGATVFVTGASGFLGKQLVEKLLRSCKIKKLFLLIRPKKGYTVEERFQSLMSDLVYSVVRDRQPDFVSRISPVEGDAADIRLGLSDQDWSTLINEVDIIFHLAATVRFDEPLKVATLINVRGTREVITLARECTKLRCLNYVSTAFAHATASRIGSDVQEQFYPSPAPPDVIIKLVETVHEDRLNSITQGLMQDWPNTYTFTKALAEELIRTTAADLPVCIVKPPFVTNAYVEPMPGWVDKTSLAGPMGVLLGVGMGVLHVFYTNCDTTLSYAPVDYVNNATIAATWDADRRRSDGDTEIPIYTISASNYGVNFQFIGDHLRSDEFVRLSTPKAVWYCYEVETNNRVVYWFLTWFLHYIPAYIGDAVCSVFDLKPKGLPISSFVKIYALIYKISMVYHYFFSNEWNFKDDQLQGMIARMTPDDKIIYNCDLGTIDYVELVKAWCIGLRKYIVKDGLKRPRYAYRKQRILKYANILFLIVYTYVIWKIIGLLFWFLCVVFNFK